MKKLNKDQQIKVESVKELITKYQESQTVLYDHLVTQLDGDSDWLYDYIFNCTTRDNDEYTSMVRDILFE